jgi:hypothetical protein
MAVFCSVMTDILRQRRARLTDFQGFCSAEGIANDSGDGKRPRACP